jgi:hypothetical protein
MQDRGLELPKAKCNKCKMGGWISHALDSGRRWCLEMRNLRSVIFSRGTWVGEVPKSACWTLNRPELINATSRKSNLAGGFKTMERWANYARGGESYIYLRIPDLI